MNEFGRRLRAARAYAGLSQDALGKQLKRSHVYVGEIENGERTPNDGEVYMLAESCGLPMEFFTVDWSSLSEPVSADDLFSVLEEIRQATSLIPQGMKYLEGLVSDDTIRRMFPDAGGS